MANKGDDLLGLLGVGVCTECKNPTMVVWNDVLRAGYASRCSTCGQTGFISYFELHQVGIHVEGYSEGKP